MSDLSDDQRRIAASIESVLTAKDADGNWVYAQNEVRDFIAVCVFMLGVPVTPEIEGALTKFMDQFDVDEEASDDEVMKVIVDYFEQNPLSERLMKQLEELGRNELSGNRDDFDNFAAALTHHGMGQILDMVPNHMGVMGRDNAQVFRELLGMTAARYRALVESEIIF